MAGPVGLGPGGERRRVFVLVDGGLVKGVFPSWEAAEVFADENRLSLDHLMEYETRSSHPDHLHLLSASWLGDWEFQGEWTAETANWPKAPRRVRLEHYHARGSTFQLLRQLEFNWSPGLIAQINPMAPDSVLKAAPAKPAPQPAGPPPPQWKPKLSPLKPIAMNPAAAPPAPPAPKPVPALSPPMVDEPPPEPPATPRPGTTLKGPQSPSPEPLSDKPPVSTAKKPSLNLRQRAMPQPIPDFKPTVAPPPEPVTAPATKPKPAAPATPAATEPPAPKRSRHRIWPLRLILSMVALVVCWSGGLYWVFRPKPTAASIVAKVTTLANSRVLIIEPDKVFFQLPVEPAFQQRWIQSLKLEMIPVDQPVSVPNYHSLTEWAKPGVFIRPPYSVVEVSEWWNLRLRKVNYGYIHRWDDGSLLILDLETDMLIGWASATRLPELMN